MPGQGEAEVPWWPTWCADVTDKATPRHTMWLGVGCSDGKAIKRRDLPGVCDPGRSQSPHTTAAAQAARGTGSINRAEGRRGRKVET